MSLPDCIPVVVLKNYDSELPYIPAEFFNICLEESCFLDCWKVSLVVPLFKNVGERSTTKNYHPVSLLPVVNKVFEKLVNDWIVDHLEKSGIFSDFEYGFRSSRSTSDLLTVVSGRIAMAVNKSRATQAVALDIFKAFDKIGFLVRYLTLFLLFSVIDGFGWFWKGILYKNIQLMLKFCMNCWSYIFPVIH